jgi:hypothetical protein
VGGMIVFVEVFKHAYGLTPTGLRMLASVQACIQRRSRARRPSTMSGAQRLRCRADRGGRPVKGASSSKVNNHGMSPIG